MITNLTLNSSTMHTGIAPPHGLQLSILRSNNTVSIFGFCANISAAHAPDGPPPTTATLYLPLADNARKDNDYY